MSPAPKSPPCLIGLLLCCLSAAQAGTQAGTQAGIQADGDWRGSGGAAVSASSGNSESASVLLNLDLARLTDVDKISLGGAYNYGRSQTAGVTTLSAKRWNAFGQYDHNLSARSYLFGKLGLEADELAFLDWRIGMSTGLGYKLADTEATRFSVFGGAGYTEDRYSQPQRIDGRLDTRFRRANLVFGQESQHQLTANTSLKQWLELAPGLSGDKARLTRFSSGLAVAMNRSLSLSMGLTITHNSAPPAGRKATDSLLFTGIQFKLGQR